MESTDLNYKDNKNFSDEILRKLLLKCILADDGIFVKSFTDWEKKIVIDDLDFQSFKLLSILYPKLLKFNLSSKLALRIKSANRRTWTENQILLTQLQHLFTAFENAKIEIIVADENIRLTEIYNDISIFSLQNFSVISKINYKKEICDILIENLWEISDNNLEKTHFVKNKAINIKILWINENEFSSKLKNAELLSVQELLQPILCIEEQILNLCATDYCIFGEQSIRWQLIISELFKAHKINEDKLIKVAQHYHLSHHLRKLLEQLNYDFDLGISDELLKKLKKYSKPGRILSFKIKFQNLRQSYQMYLNYKNQTSSINNFHEFLAKRWQVNSNKLLLKYIIRSGKKLLQFK